MLVVEVGGTTIRAARYEPAERRLYDRRAVDTPVPCQASPDGDPHTAVLSVMANLAADVLAGSPPDAAAVAYAGPVDRLGRVLAAPTVLGRGGDPPLPLGSACARLWPEADVHVLNDLTAAGYRYVGAGLRDFAIVTVGSGIGHKVFLDGRPLLGPGHRGGEIGHLRLDFAADAPRCDCGGAGHLGALASGRGTVNLLRRCAEGDPAGFRASSLGQAVGDPESLDGLVVAAAYRSGDAFTVAGVAAAVRYLGQGLAAIHLDSGVEHFILVGGFARALGEPYRFQVVAAAGAACWQVGQDWDEMVRLGEPDDDSGLLGAGLVAAGAVG